MDFSLRFFPGISGSYQQRQFPQAAALTVRLSRSIATATQAPLIFARAPLPTVHNAEGYQQQIDKVSSGIR